MRVPASGGLRWKNSSRITGDIICDDAADTHASQFSIETKHLKDVHVTETLRKNSKVKTLWKQAEADGIRSGKTPLLCLRRNGMVKGSYEVFVNSDTYWILRSMGLVAFSAAEDIGIYGFTSDDLLKINFQSFVERIKK